MDDAYAEAISEDLDALCGSVNQVAAEIEKLKIAMVGIGLLLGSQRYQEPEKLTGAAGAMAEDAMEHLHDALGLDWTPRCARKHEEPEP